MAATLIERTLLSPAGPACLAGAVGVAAVGALAAWGGLGWREAAIAMGAIAAICGLIAWRAREAFSQAVLRDQAQRPDTHSDGSLFRSLLEQLPEPVLLAGLPEGDHTFGPRLLFANAAARSIFHVADEGGPLAASVRHPLTLEAVDEALFGRASEAVIEAAGAQERVWRAHAIPVRTPTAGLRAALLALSDETGVRRAERARADFLANASHELRTPLASVTGFIETLRGPARHDEAARDRFLGIMAAQAGRMGRLVEDLLSLSRIELNEHIEPQDEVDLGLAVRDVLDALGGPRPGRALVEADLPPAGGVIVRGDRDQIIQVAQNLVDNALKYARGQVRIRVETGAPAARLTVRRDPAAARLTLLEPEHAAGRRYALLHVVDDGPGMARANLPRLSERFYRIAGQKSGETSGTGLGLAIVKHILNRHKGGLAVESAEGAGAAFTASFPLAV